LPPWGNLTKGTSLIVGQSACTQCIEGKEPFYGFSGELLDLTFDLLEIRKEEFAISNVVSHNPPSNRASTKVEIENCSPYVTTLIGILEPKVVITLGRDATEVIKRGAYSIKKSLERRVWIKHYTPVCSSKDRQYVWIIEGHPSYYYRTNDQTKWEDYSKRLAFKIRGAWKIAERRGI